MCSRLSPYTTPTRIMHSRTASSHMLMSQPTYSIHVFFTALLKCLANPDTLAQSMRLCFQQKQDGCKRLRPLRNKQCTHPCVLCCILNTDTVCAPPIHCTLPACSELNKKISGASLSCIAGCGPQLHTLCLCPVLWKGQWQVLPTLPGVGAVSRAWRACCFLVFVYRRLWGTTPQPLMFCVSMLVLLLTI